LKKKLSILIALGLAISMLVVPMIAQAAPVGLTGGVYTNTLTLENKDSSWAIIKSDGIGGTLGYNAVGSTFDWGLQATGITDGTYALIYYADYSGDRYGTWGGDSPGAVIATVTATSGVISTSGSVDLGMDLPCPPDANQFEHDYSGTPDFYANAHGAKIWLVPTSALTSGTALPVTAWPPTNDWLFETDLIWYDDTDVVSNILAITVAPTAIDFGVLIPGQTSSGYTVRVTNSGDVPTDVTATAGPATSVYAYLALDGSSVNAYTASLPLPTDYADTVVTLPVPSHWVPIGAETGTLTFIATQSP